MGLTLPSDLFPSEVVATVTGLTGLAAGLSGTLFTLLVGTLVDRFSYVPAFIVAATAPVLRRSASCFSSAAKVNRLWRRLQDRY